MVLPLLVLLGGCASAGQVAAPPPAAPLPMDACPEAPPRSNGQLTTGGPLMPSGVTAIRVCVYPLDGLPVRTTLLTGDAASRRAAELSTLPPVTRTVACPADAGPALVLLAHTADGTIALTADTGGCGVVSNGLTARMGRQLMRELAAEAGP